MPGAVVSGAGGGVISFAGFTGDTVVATPAFYRVDSDGRLYSSNDLVGATRWIVNGAPSNYEIRATATSGTVSSGTVGSWLALSSDQTWQKNSGNCTLLLEIRDKYTTTVVASATVDLQA